MTLPSARVVIPTTAGAQRALQALEALGPEWRPLTTVVDNASADDTAGSIRQRYPEVTVMRMSRNLGFAAAINAALEDSDADVVVTLNDDVFCSASALERLVAAFEDSKVGMAGGVLVHIGTGSVDTAGLRCDRALNAVDVLKGEARSAVGQAGRDTHPVGPSAGFAGYRRTAFEAVGGFDAGFFAYYEDLDLALRLRAAGWTGVLVTDAHALHVGSATLGWKSRRKLEVVGRSRGRMLAKYGVLKDPRALPSLLLELGACAVLAVEQRSLVTFRARYQGYRDCTTRLAFPRADFIGLRDVLRTFIPRLARRRWPKQARGSA